MDQDTAEAMERFAGAAMRAACDDRDALADLSVLLSDIPVADEAWRPFHEACRTALVSIRGDDPTTMNAFRLAVKAMQEAMSGDRVGTGARDDDAFVLPPWVEEDIFSNFLAHQGLVLDEMEAAIMAGDTSDPEALGDLRRKLHTLKGEAGVLGLSDLESVCHAWEDALDGEPGNAGRVDASLAALDWIRGALQAYRVGQRPDGEGSSLLREFKGLGSEEATPPQASSSEASNRVQDPGAPGCTDQVSIEPWDEETLEVVEEFITESEEGLGQVDEILLSMEPEGAHPEKVNAIFRVFHTIKGVAAFLELRETTTLAHAAETLLNRARGEEIVIDRTGLDLLFDATAQMRAMILSIASAARQRTRPSRLDGTDALVARLYGAGAAGTPHSKVETSEVAQPEAPDPDRTRDSTPSKSPVPDSPAPKGNPMAAAHASPPKARGVSAEKKLKDIVRVDVERVESLVGLIGELVIVESMIHNAAEINTVASPALREHFSQMYKITRDLQDLATRMRMVSVKAVFQKMARMVRDVAHQRGKAVRAVLEGEDTEMDRHVVEQISDPLVHMIRNAVDHGIEDAAGRAAAGKPADGTVYLRASHQGGNVVIEVSDDGQGLDRDAILATAIEKGIVGEGEKLSEEDIYQLIFAPGFSTAKVVTEISGRGVGMDVVRRNIEGMRGAIRLSSTPGLGSTVTILLPLTLAIIDGMLIVCGDERYILPSLSVVELVQVRPSMISCAAGQGELVRIRESVLPLYRLDQLLGIQRSGRSQPPNLVVVIDTRGRRIGLAVDDILAQQQVVIKGLGQGLPEARYLSGSAILSDGQVGLILNPDEIETLADRSMAPRQPMVDPQDPPSPSRALQGCAVT